MTKEELRDQIYKAALRALMIRNGGSLAIPAEEMPTDPFSIAYRITPEGGVEMKLQDGGPPQ